MTLEERSIYALIRQLNPKMREKEESDDAESNHGMTIADSGYELLKEKSCLSHERIDMQT